MILVVTHELSGGEYREGQKSDLMAALLEGSPNDIQGYLPLQWRYQGRLGFDLSLLDFSLAM